MAAAAIQGGGATPLLRPGKPVSASMMYPLLMAYKRSWTTEALMLIYVCNV